MENERVLTGIELRKAVLEATGWTFGANYSFVANKDWGAYSPNGQIWFAARTLSYAIEGCPAVESSVDAALEWLKLDSGCGWVYESPIVDHEEQKHRACITNWQTRQSYHGIAKTAGEAMCRAYLAWKAGA